MTGIHLGLITAILAVAPTALAPLLVPSTGAAASQQPASGADHMRHRFDDPEAYAKSFDDPTRDAWQMPSRVIDALGLQRGHVVADIGAGTGYFSTRLARAAVKPTVFAVDIEPSMVTYVTARAAREGLGNLHAVQGTATSPNLPEPVDLVLVVDTFHHIGVAPPTSPASGRGSARAAGWRSSTSGRTRLARGRQPSSGSRRSRSPRT